MFFLYAVLDDFTGEFSLPFCAQNDKVAFRTFRHSVDASERSFHLFLLGVYNQTTGAVESVAAREVTADEE